MDYALPTGSTEVDLRAEVVALRILIATLVWKAGGHVDVYQGDVELATSSCQLHAIPLPTGNGTRWFVDEEAKGHG
jgi:hypothetical protein